MRADWISLGVFAACYALFVAFPNRRPWVACAGAVTLVLVGVLPWREALLGMVNWNVMGLFFGTLVLAELFMLSRVPAVLAERLVDLTTTSRSAMLALCALSGGISIFVENVAVVLLVAPIALSLADKLKINPTPLLVGIAVSSNLQGTATMIGDPPSMILAGYMRMKFFDFFWHQGRPGIFFAVQVGAVASLLVLACLFRGNRERAPIVRVERVRSMVPSALLLVLVAGLSMATFFDPEFTWFAGTFTLALAAIGMLWFAFLARWGGLPHLMRAMDWETTFFLIGVFVIVGGLSYSGWLDRLAELLAGSLGTSLFVAFVAVVALAVLISAVVDNVPFLLVMIPVVQKACDVTHAPVTLLLYGLLIGTCLGGNLTPVGASANVVVLGILRKRGYAVSFSQFMRIGIPFTAAAVLAASAFLWWIWGS